MKSIITTVSLFLLCAAGLARAQNSATLEWDANTEPVSGYRLYQKVVTPPPAGFPGTAPPAVTWNLITETTGTVTTATVTNIPVGSSTYAVTAFNSTGESPRSNEATVTIAPIPGIPGNLRVKIISATP